MSRAARIRITTVLAGLTLFSTARGEEGAMEHDQRSEDGIAQTIRTRDALLNGGSRADLREQRKTRRTRLMQELGLDVVFTYDSLALGALGNDAGWGASSGDATLNVRWQIIADTRKAPLSFNLRVRDRHAYSDLAPSDLKSATGALWGHVDGFTNAGFQVPEVYFENKLFDKRLTIRYGQMTIDDLLDGHQLRSAKRSFLNQAFSSSPGVGFPSSDLGLLAQWKSRAGWDITLAMSNVASSNLRESTEWKFSGEAYFEAVQLGYNFQGLGGKQGRVQLLGWSADALPAFDIQSGRGASLTVEHEVTGRAHSFLRYAWAEGESSVTAHFAAAGLALDLRKSDRLGISVAGGNSTRNDDAWETVVELFYRWQAGPSFLITPDLQFVTGDGIGGGADWLVIGGVRVGFTF